MIGDLHMHSRYSDGCHMPAQLAEYACSQGCRAAVLTDHDTINGLDEFIRACAVLGLKTTTGIEISTYSDLGEVHILGYGFCPDRGGFGKYLDELTGTRRERAARILDKLDSFGKHIPRDYFADKCRGELSRAHIAQALADLKYAPDYQSAFLWMKEGAPAYVSLDTRTPREAIERIAAAGGTAVLAHPSRLRFGGKDLERFLHTYIEYGLAGIEAVYRNDPPSTTARLLRIAKRFGLAVTCGSDYHREPGRICPRELQDKTVQLLKLAQPV